MRYAHQVRKVRAAEQALMAQVPPGALMQRAAAGLASVSAGLVGRVTGARVVVLAGSGDNGGDALYAGARLAGRGAAVLAVTAARGCTSRAPRRCVPRVAGWPARTTTRSRRPSAPPT